MNQTIKPCVLAIVLLFAGWPAWAQTNLLGDIQTCLLYTSDAADE